MAFLPPWRRCIAAVVAAAVLAPAVLSSTTALAKPSSDAKASLADADKAVRAKDWATAAKLFDAANKTLPSSEALDGLVEAHADRAWVSFARQGEVVTIGRPIQAGATQR